MLVFVSVALFTTKPKNMRAPKQSTDAYFIVLQLLEVLNPSICCYNNLLSAVKALHTFWDLVARIFFHSATTAPLRYNPDVRSTEPGLLKFTPVDLDGVEVRAFRPVKLRTQVHCKAEMGKGLPQTAATKSETLLSKNHCLWLH